jgi:hypothetical protein
MKERKTMLRVYGKLSINEGLQRKQKQCKESMDATSSHKINSKGGTQNSKMLNSQWKLMYVPTTFLEGEAIIIHAREHEEKSLHQHDW